MSGITLHGIIIVAPYLAFLALLFHTSRLSRDNRELRWERDEWERRYFAIAPCICSEYDKAHNLTRGCPKHGPLFPPPSAFS